MFIPNSIILVQSLSNANANVDSVSDFAKQIFITVHSEHFINIIYIMSILAPLDGQFLLLLNASMVF